ncbi:MAG: pyridoxamine 5'-phosphate oxidase family protein [Amaricoccus sp.]
MPEDRMSADEAVDTVWDLVKSIDFCMFVTWDGERQRARPMSARPRRDEHRIYFLADVKGEKDDQLARFPKVTLAFADNSAHDYVVVTGTAEVSDDRAKIKDLWTGTDRAWWDDADDPDIRLIAVAPEDAELWQGPHGILATAKLVAAAATGAKSDFGENVKLDRL